ncbi:MAG: DUF447 family protein [Chloroflexi bacterium]|nr:DUF447 family protein [Chloroflexota bacterium]
MIIETIFSTLDASGRPNFAPMGVLWGEEEVIVRPFRSTHTCRNLLATGYGVANVTDDVLAFVQSALDDVVLPHFPAISVPGVVFQGACYWRELAVVAAAETAERAEVRCRVVGRGWQRDFLGFCRARSAVIEATILATRLHLHDRETVLEELRRYGKIVRKTGNDAERVAFERVAEFVRRWLSDRGG